MTFRRQREEIAIQQSFPHSKTANMTNMKADLSLTDDHDMNHLSLDGIVVPQSDEEESVSEDEYILDSPLMERSSKTLYQETSATISPLDELSLDGGLLVPNKGNMARKSTDYIGCSKGGRVFSPRVSAARKQVRSYSLEEDEIFCLSEGTAKLSMQTSMPRSRKTKEEKAAASLLDETSKMSSQAPMPRSHRSSGVARSQRRKKSDSPKSLPPMGNREVRRCASDTPEAFSQTERRRPSRQAHLGRRRVHSPSQTMNLTRKSSSSSQSASRSTTPPRSGKVEPVSPSTCATENSSSSSILTPMSDPTQGNLVEAGKSISDLIFYSIDKEFEKVAT